MPKRSFTAPDGEQVSILSILSGGPSQVDISSPARQLMLAVLEDAMSTLLDNRPIAGRYQEAEKIVAYNEAHAWIVSGRKSGPFTFHVICETLGLEPGAARKAILKMLESPAPAPDSPPPSRPRVRSVASSNRHRIKPERP